MNLKKIIKEEMDNSLQWIMDVKSYPTLQQLFDRGEIKEGDILVLRGEIENGTNEEITWVNDFTITVKNIAITLHRSSFDLDPNNIEVKKAIGLSDLSDGKDIAFLMSDGNLEVIRKNNKSTQLTESQDDPFKWIKEVPNQLPKNIDWWLINDIDPYSYKVSEEIQDFLFDQGLTWITGRKEFLPEIFSAISYRGETHGKKHGVFGYYPPTPNIEKEIKDFTKNRKVEIYYWSQLKPFS